jgi:hypothetical protein
VIAASAAPAKASRPKDSNTAHRIVLMRFILQRKGATNVNRPGVGRLKAAPKRGVRDEVKGGTDGP